MITLLLLYSVLSAAQILVIWSVTKNLMTIRFHYFVLCHTHHQVVQSQKVKQGVGWQMHGIHYTADYAHIYLIMARPVCPYNENDYCISHQSCLFPIRRSDLFQRRSTVYEISAVCENWVVLPFPRFESPTPGAVVLQLRSSRVSKLPYLAARDVLC